MSSWLVILDGPMDAVTDEVLRIAVGALAAGAQVTCAYSDDVSADVENGQTSDAADDYLPTLMQAGMWTHFNEVDWPVALKTATRVVRRGAIERSKSPSVLVIDEDLLASTNERELARVVLEAGQVLRALK